MRKPKQKLEQKLEIPEIFVTQLEELGKKAGSTVAEYLLKTLEEKDGTKQTANLKQAIDNIKKSLLFDENDGSTLATIVQVLSYIFMDCDGKNPCRRTIASFFQTQNDAMWHVLLEYMSKALLNTLKETMTKTEKGSNDVNFRKHVDTICSLLENFSMGEKCVSINLITVLEFLAMSLEYQITTESLVGTPALQTVAMLDCLVTIKAVMSVIQKCTNQESQIFHDHKFVMLNQRFVKVIVKILKNDAFFPDCRSAAGMAFPLLIRTVTTRETMIPVIVSLFFSSYIRQPFSQPTLISSHWMFTFVNEKSIKDMPGFSFLSICRGVMAMVTKDMLVAKQNFISNSVSNDYTGTLLLDVLFPEITALCTKLKDSNSVIAFRALANWTSLAREAVCSSFVDDSFKSRLCGSSPIAQKLLNFVWNYWDHPLETMRYHTREIFNNVVKTHVTLSLNSGESIGDLFMEELTKKLCQMDWFIRGKYGPLCCLVDNLGAHVILGLHSSVPQDLMMVMCDQSIVPHAMEFAEKMFLSHYEKLVRETEQHLETWFKVWVVPGLHCLLSGDKSSRKHVTEYYIPKLLKCCPQSLHLMIRELQEPATSSKGGNDRGNVGGLVTCLKTARHLGLLPRVELFSRKEEEKNVLWQNTISLVVLEQSLCHLDDEEIESYIVYKHIVNLSQFRRRSNK